MFWRGPQFESYFEVIWRFWVRMRSDWRGTIFWQHEVPVMIKMNDFVPTFTAFAVCSMKIRTREAEMFQLIELPKQIPVKTWKVRFGFFVCLFVVAHDSIRTNLSGCSDLAELPLPRICLSQYLSKRLKIQTKASNSAFWSKNRVVLKRIGASID